jgi:hypothetical protein
LVPIAATGDRFTDFAPCVATVDDDGLVAFQAALAGGGSGVFAGDGGGVTTLADSDDGVFADFTSHPALGASGAATFYAERRDGTRGVFLARDGRVSVLAETGGAIREIGPLGPTMNAEGVVAFRADLATGTSAIFKAREGKAAVLFADTSGAFAAFHGLPVIDARGTVTFRADRRDGAHVIYSSGGGAMVARVESGDRFVELGAFPDTNDDGTIVFAAKLTGGGSGIFASSADGIAKIVDEAAGFESFRGALIDERGQVTFFATPRDGALGIFAGPDPLSDRVLGIGDPWIDSTVTDFALNPVSMSPGGRLAIRLALADGRQLVVRADPRG